MTINRNLFLPFVLVCEISSPLPRRKSTCFRSTFSHIAVLLIPMLGASLAASSKPASTSSTAIPLPILQSRPLTSPPIVARTSSKQLNTQRSILSIGLETISLLCFFPPNNAAKHRVSPAFDQDRSYAVEGIVQNGFARYGRTAERTMAAWAAYQLRPVCSR